MGIVRFSSFWGVVFVGPFFVMITFLAAYTIAGPAFFGPTLMLFWALTVIGFVLAVKNQDVAATLTTRNSC